jgi:hypothetical protein
VKLRYTTERGRRVSYWRWNWWGPYRHGGCKDLNLSVRENTDVYYRVCLGNYGHPGGRPADVIESSCSPWGYASN